MIYRKQIADAIIAIPELEPAEVTGINSTRFALDTPNVIRVPSNWGLRLLLGELTAADIVPHDVASNIVRHEGQHESAWRILGAGNIAFGLRLYYLKGTDTLGITAFVSMEDDTNYYSPLERAAVFAHPTDPSEGDVAQIIEEGFGGIAEVAERAMINNIAGGKHIPVPLSFRLS